MHRNPKTLTTFFSSGTKLLLPSWLLGFQHEERNTIFTMLTVPSGPTTHGAPRRPTGLGSPRLKNQLASPRSESQLTVFFSKITQNPQPIASVHDVIHILSLISIRGSYNDICDCHILPHERVHLNPMCAPTRPLSRIVLSRTKPKDKI